MVWLKTTLGKVCDVRDGTHDSPKYQETGYPLVTSKNLKNGEITLNKIKYISESDFLKINERSAVHRGDVLFAMIGTIGNPVVIKHEPNFAIKNVALFKTGEKVDSQFLKYYFESPYVIEKMGKEAKGTTQKFVGLGYLRSFPVLLPPILEQKHIVTILDQAFADIDKARANAEQNLKNARELFESYLQQVFSQHTDGWKYKKWGELCDFVRGPFGGSLKKSMFKEEGFVVYEQKHAIHNHFNQLRYFIDEEKFNEMKRFEVKAGDIIMSCSGVTLGRVAIIPEDIPRGIINQALLKLTPKKEISVEFLKHWLRSKIFQDIIFKHSGGAAIPNVPSAKIMKEIVIPLPSLAEQKKIVCQIELLLEKTNNLKFIYQKKIEDLDELKKSILQKAFTGELTRTKVQTESNVIPFPTKLPNISTTDLHAGILALAYQAHEQAAKPQQFGHVKAEKIAHLAEAMLGVELDRTPIQDAAGPNDYLHFKSKVEPRAKKAGFFIFKGSKQTGYILQKGSRFDGIADKARQALSDAGYLASFDNLMQLLVKMDTEKAEIFATVYAAWNNLLLDKVDITDEAIVQAARENWHTSKLKIPRERFFNAIAWMRAQDVIPTGKGKYVQANGGGK